MAGTIQGGTRLGMNMVRRTRPLREVGMALTAGLALCGTMAIAARASEYKLQSGDVVNVMIGNLPELRVKEAVDMDGKVLLPVIGAVPAAGLTLTELREALKGRVNNKLYRQITQDGKENMLVLSGEECAVAVATYRPIYVNGDVAKPGELEFKVGITVRQAIAMAGGQDVLRARLVNPMDALDFRATLVGASTEQVGEELRVARIQAELDDATTPNFSSVSTDAIDPKTLNSMKEIELRQFSIRRDSRAKEKAILGEAVVSTNERIAVLRQQLDKEAQGEREDAADLERAKELVQKGNAPMTRVSDARRTSLFSATRVLQTASQVNVLERERDDLKAKIAKVDFEARVALAKDLQEAKVKLLAARARADGAREKLGSSRSAVPAGIEMVTPDPSATVFRTTNGQEERLAVGLDFALKPGDALQVANRPAQPTE
jgi:polysaccharide biosynthesis/export protein